MTEPVRLHKLIAQAGLASRRAAEHLIAAGRVTVNGRAVRQPGASAVPGVDDVRVDGVPLARPAAHTYLLLNKPPGYVTTVRDPHAERTVMDLLPADAPRLFPAGRLDRDSEGLLLLTDDGDLAQRLLHPRHRVEREYAVLVRAEWIAPALAKLRAGADVAGTHVSPRLVERRPPPFQAPELPGRVWLRVTLTEGRKREVRVLCAAAGLDVLRLVRVRFGPLTLGDLAPGETRPLTEAEVKALAPSGRVRSEPGPFPQ